MPNLGNMVQKAFYLGVGLASYAGEQASTRFQDLRNQAQKLADEMVRRGEMSAEDASQWVDDMLQQAQQPPTNNPQAKSGDTTSREPRRIEILEDDEETGTNTTSPDGADNLRQQVEALQAELRRLQKEQ